MEGSGFPEVATAVAAGVSVLLACGKVLAPQYLIWLVPLVPLVGVRVPGCALLLLLAACVVSHLYDPRHFYALTHMGAAEIWLLLARDAVVVALAVTLLRVVASSPPLPVSSAEPLGASVAGQHVGT